MTNFKVPCDPMTKREEDLARVMLDDYKYTPTSYALFIRIGDTISFLRCISVEEAERYKDDPQYQLFAQTRRTK